METKDFAEALVGRLARNDFHAVGSLAAYLALPERNRSGDEANIVDIRVSRVLLEALGYGSAEIDYNAGKDNLRPDYVVRIRDFPGCCFIIEDKATNERQLETHRPQLGGYMAAFRCPRGLLAMANAFWDMTIPAQLRRPRCSSPFITRFAYGTAKTFWPRAGLVGMRYLSQTVTCLLSLLAVMVVARLRVSPVSLRT